MTTIEPFQPVREPLWRTFRRTGTIAAVVGFVLVRPWLTNIGLTRWFIASLIALWPPFGGHYVELAYLNGLRPRLPPSHFVRSAVRIGIWFAGGALLSVGMMLTASVLDSVGPASWLAHRPLWRVPVAGGIAFIAIELVVHVILQLRGAPNFYNSRG
jgi:hypothetical protein